MLSVGLFSQPLGNSLHGFLAVLMLAEGGESDVAFARWAEAIYTPEGKEQVKATINYYMENFQLGVLFGVFTQIYGAFSPP